MIEPRFQPRQSVNLTTGLFIEYILYAKLFEAPVSVAMNEIRVLSLKHILMGEKQIVEKSRKYVVVLYEKPKHCKMAKGVLDLVFFI